MRAMPSRMLLTLLLALGISLQGLGGQAAAVPSQAWSISSISFPTNLPPGSSGDIFSGPGYLVAATNIGGEPTSGPFTITGTLPLGLSPAAGAEPFGEDLRGNVLSCESSGQVVTCTGSEPVEQGGVVRVWIPVDVAADAPAEAVPEIGVSGGGALPVSTTTPTQISADPPEFGFLSGANGLYTEAANDDGSAATQAGSHPYQMNIGMGFPSQIDGLELWAVGNSVKDIGVDLPPGMVVNPNATAERCTTAQLAIEDCPDASQVGYIVITLQLGGISYSVFPVFNMIPPHGTAAELGFLIQAGLVVNLRGRVRTGGDYGLSADADDILAKASIYGTRMTLWANPTDPSHDRVRGDCLTEVGGVCPVERRDVAAVTLPSACSAPLQTSARAASWEEPEIFDEASAETRDNNGTPVDVRGCSLLEFDPSLTLRPDVDRAETPTGLHVDLHIPQTEGAEERATANLEDTTVTLPPGLTVNPAAATGLAACAPAEIELDGPLPARCPEAAKIGTVEVDTPLLDHPLPGAVYVASPYDNPFGSLLALYLVVDDPQTGVVVKLAGKVEARPVGKTSSQLVTTFAENPQLPFEDFELDFFGGPRAALRTPATCGEYVTESELAPWSGTAPVKTTDTFQISEPASGGRCPLDEAAAPNDPDFSAGTATPLAGRPSEFAMRLSREDGSQVLEGLSMTLPPGLTGKLAGIPACPDAALAAATTKMGRDEQASPSCPDASAVGRVSVGAGAGTQPHYVEGRAYLAGPYKGAPLSLAIVTPAVAGPFDLGTVVVRAALHVDPRTAQISVESDPIPTILEGIPLAVRDVRVRIDRADFTRNPTSCEPMAIAAESVSVPGQVAPLSDRFQVGGCDALIFKPRLGLRLFGGSRRGAYQRLRAILGYPPHGVSANVARAAVTLPHASFLAQEHIGTVCTRVQFAADACPARSVYGRARAVTPLLDDPLQGPVYLRSSDNELPDLVAALRGPADQPIEIELVGRTDSVRGALRNTFDAAPDAPVSKFTLELFGGEKALIVNSEHLCRKRRHLATVKLRGHNGATANSRIVVQNGCRDRQRSRPR